MEATTMPEKNEPAPAGAVKAAVKAATEEAAKEASSPVNLSEEELQILSRYRTAGEDVLREIGQIEIRKARLIGSFGQLETASQTKLQEVGKRLGIDEGVPWSVQPDGSVVVHEGSVEPEGTKEG
jgi:hypothetical protein